MPGRSAAQVVAVAPYTETTFATPPTGLSAPDSVTFSSTNVFIGYGNNGAPDGSGGAMSDVVEYDFTGKELKDIKIVGHNDGLRFNPRENNLWALQNEDGNANLSIIDLKTGDQKIYQLGTGPHGGGYDDIDFNNGSTYLSASAPTLTVDTAPAIVSLKLKGKTPELTGILDGNATVTNALTGEPEALSLTDPDSMIVDPYGELVMVSQGDGLEIIVQHPGLSCQKAFVVPLTSALEPTIIGDTQLDDTVFATEPAGQLLVADKGSATFVGAVYSITTPYFAPGLAYSAVSVFPTPTANESDRIIRQPNRSQHRLRDTNCQRYDESGRDGVHSIGSRPGKIRQSFRGGARSLPGNVIAEPILSGIPGPCATRCAPASFF